MVRQEELIGLIRNKLVEQFESELYSYNLLRKEEKDMIAVDVIKAIDSAFNAVYIKREFMEMD